MKIILFFALLLCSVFVNAQKLKYKKNVYPLVKSGNIEAALPMLEAYLKQDPDHTNAHYWAAKFYEQKLNGPDSIANIKLAIGHWQEAKRTVSVGEMMTANASKYPDIKGSATNDRILQFTQMSDAHISNLLAKEVAIKENVAKLALDKKNEEERIAKEIEKEANRKKEEAELKRVEAERIAKEKAEQTLAQSEAKAIADKALAEKEMLDKNVKLKNVNGFKISEFITLAKLNNFESFLPEGMYYTNAMGQLIEINFSGYYFYNLIEGKEVIQGKFNLIAEAKGLQGNVVGAISNVIATLNGELKNGTGSLDMQLERAKINDKELNAKIRASFVNGNMTTTRGETDPLMESHLFYEATATTTPFIKTGWLPIARETQAQTTLLRMQLTNTTLNGNVNAVFNGLKLEKGKTILNKEIVYSLKYGSDITAAQKTKLVNAKRYKLVLTPYVINYQLFTPFKGYILVSSTLVK